MATASRRSEPQCSVPPANCRSSVFSIIHPKAKDPVGARLALAARAIAFGKKIECSGPVFDKLKISGDGTTFVPANAVIAGDTVVVTSDTVASPVAVRFDWANVPVTNLFNKNDLPATPFRTDQP